MRGWRAASRRSVRSETASRNSGGWRQRCSISSRDCAASRTSERFLCCVKRSGNRWTEQRKQWRNQEGRHWISTTNGIDSISPNAWEYHNHDLKLLTARSSVHGRMYPLVQFEIHSIPATTPSIHVHCLGALACGSRVPVKLKASITSWRLSRHPNFALSFFKRSSS